MIELNKIYQGDALKVLQTFPNEFIDCCITSPPYWGLRDYGVADQLGLEKTPEEFITKLANIFDEVKRVLKPTGTLWVNIGDSYGGSGKGAATHPETNHKWKQGTNIGTHNKTVHNFVSDNIKPKDLVGIPWMLAFELRRRGWYLRQDIIWSKPNPMPESVTDRCTKSHEYVFLLSKSSKYYYDAEAIKVPSLQPEDDRGARGNRKRIPTDKINGIRNSSIYPMANKRSVWDIVTKGFSEAHFATFPEELIEPCILAGTSEAGCCSECGKSIERIVKKQLVPTNKASFNSIADKRNFEADTKDQGSNRQKDGHKPGWAYLSKTIGWKNTCTCRSSKVPAIVLDPFSGAGTTAMLAKKKGRDYIGIELNEKYIAMSEKRLYNELGMFA